MSVEQTSPKLRSTRVKATPRARRIMSRQRQDLSNLAGSGPNGRILEFDVRARSAEGVQTSAYRRPFVGMRRSIARRLLLSKLTIPHFYIRQTIDASSLVDFYKSQKAKFPCSLNDFIIKAVSNVVGEFSIVRSRVDGEDIIEEPNVHIGFAVRLTDGLVVPTVMHADRLSLRELAGETRRIIDLAKEGKYENLGKSVFSVTNLGMFGVDDFIPIINPPESAILAVGAVREQAMAKQGTLYAGRALTLTLSCDHRVIDGVVAAQFLGRLKEILESPQAHFELP